MTEFVKPQQFKISKGVFGQIILIIFFLFQLFLFYLNGVTQTQIEILKYELCVFYLLILQYSYRKYGAFNLYVLFLFTMFIFIYARIFLDILGFFDFGEAYLMDSIYLPVRVQFELLSLLIISLLCINLGHSFRTPNDLKEHFRFEYFPELEWWSLFFFLLSLPGTAYKYLLELKVILANGYLALFDGTLAELSYPLWTAGAGTLFICSYAIFLSSRPSRKKFLIVSFIFFFLNFLNMLKGSRSRIFVPLLFILWFYYTFYKEKPTVSFWKLALIATGAIIFSQWMVVHRVGSDVIELSNVLNLFLVEQGVSVLILGYMIFYKNIFVNNSIPYILGPLSLIGIGEGQTFESIQQTHLLSHKLTYFLSPESFFNGAGVGSSFLGEFYDLGIVAFVFLSLFVGYIISHMVSYVKKSRLIFVLSYFFVQTIVYMPRNSFFPLLVEVLPCLLFYFIIMWVVKHYGIIKLKLY